MSALANIKATTLLTVAGLNSGVTVYTSSATIADDKTYNPVGQITPGVFSYVDRSGGVPLAYPRFDFSLRQPVNGSRFYKVVGRFRLPVLEVSSGGTGSGYVALPKVAYTLQATLDILIPDVALLADRTTFFSLMMSMLADGIAASDGTPSVLTGSPLRDSILLLDQPY